MEQYYSIADIAKAVGVTHSAIHARIARSDKKNHTEFPCADGFTLQGKFPFWRESTLIKKGVIKESEVANYETRFTKLFKSYDGAKYNSLTIISEIDRDKTNRRMFLCSCDCGKQISVRLNDLISGHTKSCGCKLISGKVPFIHLRPFKNNQIGVVGVFESYSKNGTLRYKSHLRFGGKRYFVGTFYTIEEAIAARTNIINSLLSCRSREERIDIIKRARANRDKKIKGDESDDATNVQHD